jgi:hypothetical protein
MTTHLGQGLGADSGEKHEPAGDIDTAEVDGLKALDPNRPIREADMKQMRPLKTALSAIYNNV